MLVPHLSIWLCWPPEADIVHPGDADYISKLHPLTALCKFEILKMKAGSVLGPAPFNLVIVDNIQKNSNKMQPSSPLTLWQHNCKCTVPNLKGDPKLGLFKKSKRDYILKS